ncbi:L,D-transpeptidase family protein [Consotaella salsifontis]|uniref:Lipoprotein-anchoring transpeptidase ErfK/SrfK n=1 Tax=Consotaella salsifontis TaxID=1365950 RepID=A0A1T4SC51_9HYPH|nr:L,D-transpeptidase [Consotaella salsifontis]SKA25775.1 Lipoprotein-anchoring transpeptidase ErfK/SrfK [Consotaella salsifontis]
MNWSTLSLVFALGVATLSGAAQAEEGASAVDGPVVVAQIYDPGYIQNRRPAGNTHTYVDEFGRVVTVDAYGRILSIREQRDRFEERRERFRDRFDDQVRNMPPDDRYVPMGPDGRPLSPASANPYPNDGYGPPQPDDGWGADDGWGNDRGGYSGPQVPPDISNTEAPEKNPAPKVATPKGKNAKAQIAALQVLLDRAGISPGVIDGRMGSNVNKAVAAYQEKYGRTIDPTDLQALVEELDATGGPAIASYTITAEDAAGPYLASIPEDYGEKAKLPALSFTRVSEMLAERFHMDEDYLKEINPGADFSRAGTIIKVMAVGEPVKGEVTRIIADKGREQVRAYDASGTLIAAYPSTIGSSDTPSPSGTVEVKRIAFNPGYTYNPKINFKQGNNNGILEIPPGPNGPVGSIWIALSKPTYGIHGTPEPSKIGKTNSHGCVRLTNWDATELAKIVKPGVVVEFVD